MDMRTCEAELALVNRDFGDRHWQTRGVHLERYAQIKAQLGLKSGLRETRKALIGAYFCHEYSYAGAALTNPSIAPHPDQTGLVGGAVRCGSCCPCGRLARDTSPRSRSGRAL